MRWFYAAFNLVILGGPLLGAWLWFRDAWSLRRRMLLALATVSVGWIVLDALSVARGWWDYNPAYVAGVYVAGLPLEEIAFFVTVPLACMLTLYALSKGVQGRVSLRRAKQALWIGAGIVLLFAIMTGAKERTLVDCLLAIGTIMLLYRSTLITGRVFWAWNGAILLLCLVFNTMLTALPVVTYDEQFMSGIRLGTIPVEDLLYNFSLLNLTALVVRPDIRQGQRASQPQSTPAHRQKGQAQK